MSCCIDLHEFVYLVIHIWPFCTCDLDLDPVTLIFDLLTGYSEDVPEMQFLGHCCQKDRQTDTTERMNYTLSVTSCEVLQQSVNRSEMSWDSWVLWQLTVVTTQCVIDGTLVESWLICVCLCVCLLSVADGDISHESQSAARQHVAIQVFYFFLFITSVINYDCI